MVDGQLFLILGINLVVFLFCFWVGIKFGRRYNESGKDYDKSIGIMVTAQIGLVAFMIAFIFGIVASRFDAKRVSIIEESNSIGTTYLRTDLLPEPHSTDLKRIIKDYLALYDQAYKDPSTMERNIDEANKLLDKMWKIGSDYFLGHPENEAAGSFITSLNQTIDLFAKRTTVLIHLSLPLSIWITLYLLSILSALLSGFHLGVQGAKLGFAVVVFALTFSVMLTLIADLDGSRSGLFKASVKPFQELQKKVNSEVN